MDRPFYMEHYPNFLPKKYLSRNHYGRTHLEVDIERAYQHDDRRDSLHEVGDGCLVGAYFLGGLGEARRPLAASHDVADGEGECHEGERALPGERGLLETDVCT